jgi:hypothetical protein
VLVDHGPSGDGNRYDGCLMIVLVVLALDGCDSDG